MTTTKQIKIAFDGKSYWLLWHWEIVTRETATLHATATYVSGAYESLEAAEVKCKGAIVDGWTVDPNSAFVDATLNTTRSVPKSLH
jgi:hypothetical protein